MDRVHRLKITIAAVSVLSCALSVVPSGWAAAESRLSLESLIEEVTRNNPEIKAARERWPVGARIQRGSAPDERRPEAAYYDRHIVTLVEEEAPR